MKLKLKNSVAAVIIITIFTIFSQLTFAQVALDFSSYLGGSVSETIRDIAVDETGATYVMGYTSSANFPVTNAFQPTIGNPGNNYFDIFITKIAPDGTSIVFSTFLGGDYYEYGYGIAVHTDKTVYVVGYTQSTDFPVTNAFQPLRQSNRDAFVSRISADGKSLIFSTFFGGSSDDRAYDIEVGLDGSAFVTGWTQSDNFPLTNAFQTSRTGYECFVARFSPAGSNLIYSTYLGGSQSDRGYGIAVDKNLTAFVTGSSNSTNFPTTNAFQPTLGRVNVVDAFVTRFSAEGSNLIYSTFIGGDSNDAANGIDIDDESTAYITGYTESTNFPVKNAVQSTLAGDDDVFVTALDSSGTSLIYSTYFGGSGEDDGYAITVDTNGVASVTGRTRSTAFPVKGAFQSSRGSDYDSFVFKLSTKTESNLIYSTYLGGDDVDYGYAIDCDPAGDIYVAGYTESHDFPVKNPFQSTYNGGSRDGFFTKLIKAGKTFGAPYQITLNYSNRHDNAGFINNYEKYSGTSITETGEDIVFSFSIEQNREVTVKLSNLTTNLDLFYCNGPGTNFCIAHSVNSSTNNEEIVYISSAGTYYITVDGFEGATGAFNISVSAPMPNVSITTSPQTVAYDITNIEIVGTNTSDIVEMLSVSNSANGEVHNFPPGQNWIAPPISLIVGTNELFVSGTNLINVTVTDSVEIVRLPKQAGDSNLVYYVATDGHHIPPFLSWENAATQIQAAVDLTFDDDSVFVSNGIYDTGGEITPGFAISNRVFVSKSIIIKSVSGAKNTIISGKGPLSSNAFRCVYLTNGASLIGFTISNGHTFSSGDFDFELGGGGAFLHNGGIISNCVITDCEAKRNGGGVYCYYGGKILDSELKNNIVHREGAGARLLYGGEINRCHIHSNLADNWDGGGVYVYYDGIVANSLIEKNEGYSGAGVYLCNLDGAGPRLYNCTVVNNSSDFDGGGVRCLNGGSVRNCIIYNNTAVSSGNNYENLGPSISYEYSCTTPSISGTGNIDTAPNFYNAAVGDYHVLSTSLCVNAGNNSFAFGEKDLDNISRILSSTINMGCYEQSRNITPTIFDIDVPINVSPGTPEEYVCTNVEELVVAGSKSLNTFLVTPNDSGGWVTNFLVENFLLESSWTNSLVLAMSPSGVETQLVYSVGTNNMSQIIFPPVILNVKNYFVSYPAEIYISNLYYIYDGTTKEADVTISPSGLIVVTYNGSAVLPIAAGDYAVTAIVNEVYYHGTNTAILKIVYPYPFIDITNIDHTVAYNISSTEISGTNVFIEGNISWTNSFAGGGGEIPISNFHFQVSNIPLEHGDNLIEVFGTNIYGDFTNDFVTIHRETFAEVHPFIDITNVDHIVNYNISSTEISGTNLNISENLGWTNFFTGTSGNVQISNFHFQVSNIYLEHGDNLIEVFGTNIYGHFTNDFVTIHRETFAEVHPFIKITNAPAIVPYIETSTEISGTNLNIARNLYWVNNRHIDSTNLIIQGPSVGLFRKFVKSRISDFESFMNTLDQDQEYFSTIINNLEHGDNQITVFGTNFYGQSTNSVVSIRRKTLIESEPQIATNALIFPSANAELFEGDFTNIIWDVEKITDDLDGTNLTISKISVYVSETSNEVATVTNNINNLLGEIPWLVPEDLIGGDTNYVLKFDVVDSSSLTNSRIFWYNEFTIVPEPFLIFIYYLLFICCYFRRKF